MKRSSVVVWLSSLIAALALVASGVGLFWQGGSGPFSFTTARGQVVEMYGRGLYRYDTLLAGAGNRGTDAIVLSLGIPLLVLSLVLYRRGSLRGHLLLVSTLAYFLYVYATMALGAAYNPMFLVYVALFAASLFAFALAFTAIDRRALPSHFTAHMPRRGPAAFLFFGGAVTLAVWLMAPVSGLVKGQPPDRLDSYTTLFTWALDLAIIVPVSFLAGALILRREALGYLFGFALLGIISLLGPVFVAQTVSQLSAGVTFATGEIVGPIAGFGTVAVLGIATLVALLRHISDVTPATTERGPTGASPARLNGRVSTERAGKRRAMH